MPPLSIVILSDDRPGHYHLADGVAAAIGRRVPTIVTRIGIERRKLTPGRVLALALSAGVPPSWVLRVGYGLAADAVPPADVVISAGGDTLAATIAAARWRAADSIFCGTLRHVPPEQLSLVVSSYARHAALPRHIVTLKPSGLDPDTLPRRAPRRAEPRAGLLVGGPSGLFRWETDEWEALQTFLAASHAADGTRWIVSTSRRTPDAVADAFADLARRSDGPIGELIDFRSAGPGTLPRLFASVDHVLATEDSSTMISEAIAARLPTVGVSPRTHAFKPEERDYRDLLRSEGWFRPVPLADLTPQRFRAALAEVRPIEGNHLDRLADLIEARLPRLFQTTRQAAIGNAEG